MSREDKLRYVDQHWDLLFNMDPEDADRQLKVCGLYSEKTSLADICTRKLLRDTCRTDDRKARFWLKYSQWSPKEWGTIALRTVQVAYPGEKERPGGKPPLFTTPTATLIRVLREAGIKAEMVDADQIRLVDGYLKRVRSDHLPQVSQDPTPSPIGDEEWEPGCGKPQCAKVNEAGTRCRYVEGHDCLHRPQIR